MVASGERDWGGESVRWDSVDNINFQWSCMDVRVGL